MAKIISNKILLKTIFKTTLIGFCIAISAHFLHKIHWNTPDSKPSLQNCEILRQKRWIWLINGLLSLLFVRTFQRNDKIIPFFGRIWRNFSNFHVLEKRKFQKFQNCFAGFCSRIHLGLDFPLFYRKKQTSSISLSIL